MLSGPLAIFIYVFLRRWFYRWLLIAVPVLPAWIFVGWGIFGPDGWPLLTLVVVCPILLFALAVVSLLTMARASVRADHSVAWRDILTVGVWHLSLFMIGFYTPANSWLILLSVGLGLVAFWLAVGTLTSETYGRVRNTTARHFGPASARAGRFASGAEYIVVHEKHESGS